MSFVLKYAKEEQIIKDRFWGGVEEVTMVLQIVSEPKSTQENFQTLWKKLRLQPNLKTEECMSIRKKKFCDFIGASFFWKVVIKFMMYLTTYDIWYQGNMGLSARRDIWGEKRQIPDPLSLALEDRAF